MKLIYLASNNVSVLESQVFELLRFLTTHGLDVTLLQGASDEVGKAAIQKKLQKYQSLNVVWMKSYPCLPIFENRSVHEIHKALTSIPHWEEAVIHVRSEYSGYLVKKLIQRYNIPNRIVIDIRGVVFEELNYKISHHSSRKFVSLIQRHYFKRIYRYLFDGKFPNQIAISSVSTAINEYFKSKYHECSYLFTVHPNIAGSIMQYSINKRKEARSKLGLSDDDVVVLCATGGGSVWQKDRELITDFVNAGFKVINLSKQTFECAGCISTFVPFSEMPDIMSAADAGLLWREKSFINYSASPSKLSEFASMGLFILHNGTVQIAVDFIQDTQAGKLLKDTSEINPSLRGLILAQNRQSNVEAGQRVFGVDHIGVSYINLYTSFV